MMTLMAAALGWGTLAASSLVIGAILALQFRISVRAIGLIMGFGAGVLISAVAFDLVEEAVNTESGHWAVLAGIVWRSCDGRDLATKHSRRSTQSHDAGLLSRPRFFAFSDEPARIASKEKTRRLRRVSMERMKGLEPSTFCMASRCSTN